MRLCPIDLEVLEDGALTCPQHGARTLPLGDRAADARVGTRVADRYIVTAVIARGGMGVVYRAHQVALERDVALKILDGKEKDDPEFAARFEREAKLTARLRSPRVVEVYDAGRLPGGELFLTMELLAGVPLESLVQAPLPVERAVALAADVLDALADAHDLGIVHRDLKPSNVMVDARDRAKVIDFGLARPLESDDVTLTRAGQIYGTPAFLPPEMWADAPGPVSPATDLYMFGATLFQLVSGRRCFTGRSLPGLMQQHLYEPAPSLARWAAQQGVSDPRIAALDALIGRCLAKAPEQRPQDARALRAELLGIGGGASAATPSTAAPPRPEPPPTSPPTGLEATVVRGAAPSTTAAPLPAATGARPTTKPKSGTVIALAFCVLFVVTVVISAIPKRPELVLSEPRVIGRLDPARARAAVAAIRPTLERCAAPLALDGPRTLYWIVGPTPGLELRPVTPAAKPLVDCLRPATLAQALTVEPGDRFATIVVDLHRVDSTEAVGHDQAPR